MTNKKIKSNKHNYKVSLVISLILSVVPVSCTIGGGSWYYKTKLWVDSATEVNGEVIELLESEDTTQTGQTMIMYTPVIKYEYEGKIKKHTPNTRSHPKPYEQGDIVTILIDRKNPTKVAIKSYPSLYLGLTVFMIFTLPFLVIAFLAISISYALMRLSKD